MTFFCARAGHYILFRGTPCPLDTTAQSYIHLWTHVFVAPVCSVGLGVGFQDVVQIVAFRRRLHVAVQNGGCADVLGVEPADGQSGFNVFGSKSKAEQAGRPSSAARTCCWCPCARSGRIPPGKYRQTVLGIGSR